MMTLNDLKEALPILISVIVLAVFLYFFYRGTLVRKAVGVLLPWLPALFRYLANKTPDEKKVFDQHDWYALGERVSVKLAEIIRDQSNVSFEDVEQDLANLVAEELKVYKDAGIEGVPDLSSESVREQTRIIFSIISRLSSEDTPRNDG